jgi:D-galactarolactone cycloisomerase
MAVEQQVRITRVEAWVLRAPIAVPVRSSFGVMTNRPAVFLRVTDADGAQGWGEVWCNFPPVGAEHRARLAEEMVGPVLCALGAVTPSAVFAALMARFATMIIQCGEPGPFRQVCAGLDLACHDLAARRAGLPLWRHLGGAGDGSVPCYASGIASEDVEEVVTQGLAAGHRAFKLKIGFGEAVDLDGLARLRRLAGPGSRVMADANQAWTPEQAQRRMAALTAFDLAWLEEPIAADQPNDAWRRVAEVAPMPLAAGENLGDEAAFDAAIAARALRYLQPDVAKWGGVSGCLAVARRALAAGLVYCPHFLGGGIGLLASAHLLAAAGGEGLLEIDTNPNPLRERAGGEALRLRDGAVTLPEGPGLGLEPDIAALRAA